MSAGHMITCLIKDPSMASRSDGYRTQSTDALLASCRKDARLYYLLKTLGRRTQ
jgi:hypothetical protein